MDISHALTAFDALGQPTRLAVFRLLVQAGPEGVSAGDIAVRLDVRQNTLSTHLGVLVAAGLVTAQRKGRSIRYFANLTALRESVGWLLQDCCGGKPEACKPILDLIICSC
mgnify:CR=1 FL=1